MKLLWKAFKILLMLVLTAVLILGIYYLVKVMKWPWWTGAAIFVGILGFIVGVLFIKKWLFRRREEKFVKRIVEQDESIIQKAPIGERQALRDLQARWTDAVEILRKSHLKKYGNPLYVLPWFIVMGESGAGKTTAIKSSGLSTPLTDVSPATGVTGTQNCDWWFFDNAIILDTAGRYVVPLDEDPDNEEWGRFLKLLSKFRKREPINGVVAVISADVLKNSDDETLHQEARSLRRRIDELMRVLGAKFPVYILITKTDKILGLSEYGDFLPEHVLDQAMGRCNVTLRHDPLTLVDDTLDIIADRLKDLRLIVLNSAGEPDPGLLLFPDELEQLRSKLSLFVTMAFEENPYQETPLLRGVYFSSGKQEGETASQLIGGAFKDYTEDLPGTDKGFFLKDFFLSILPGDRNLFSPIKEYLSWRRVTRSLGITAWALIILSLCGLLTLSFMKNIETLYAFTKDISEPPVLTEELGKDLIMMSQFRSEILEMVELNGNWWIPRLGLDQSKMVELKLKAHFCALFRERFLNRFDKSIAAEIGGFNSETKGEVIGAFVEHLQTRINLLTSELNGASLKQLEQMPQPAYSAMIIIDDQVMPEIAAEFSKLYVSYLDWNADKKALKTEQSYLRTWLTHVAGVRGTTLNWMVNWANVNPDLGSVEMSDFWGAYRAPGLDKYSVPPAYTLEGRKKIEEFMKRYQESLENPDILDARVKSFNDWYWQEYVKAWQTFARGFAVGGLQIEDENDMRVLAQIMADSNNPYFKLLDKMSEELVPAGELQGAPGWVVLAVNIRNVKKQAKQKKIVQSAGVVAKAAAKGEKAIEDTAKKTLSDKDVKELQNTLKAVDQYVAYEEALTKIIPVTSSRQKAFKMTSDLYHTDPDNDKEDAPSPFRDAYSAFVGLKGASSQLGQDNVVWDLISGPLYFLLAYATMETSCELQSEWEGSVLADIHDMPEAKLKDELFGKDSGVVWKYISGPAAPFIKRDLSGYYPRTSLNQLFPFKKDFLEFLNQGSSLTAQLLPEYSVTIKSRPTSVNNEAILEPYATILVLECSDAPQQLENYNYPSNLEFKWKPDQCGKVTLQILFNDFTLTKNYAGVNGFPLFLSDFRDGARTFTAADFPENEKDLQNINVSEIHVAYTISGSAPLQTLKKDAPFQTPLTVVNCWGS